MTVETIYIPDDAWTDRLLAFAASSPLAACATVGYDNGAQVIRTDHAVESLSSGEKRCWALLRSLTSGDLRGLLGCADERTLAALGRLFASDGFDDRAASEVAS